MSRQTSAALLLVGSTGSGKTSLIGTLALHVWKKHQKITRLSTFDPGGYGDDVVALIDAGIIQVFRGYTRDPEGRLKLALETCSLVTRGYWPREINPKTGEAAPNVDMIAPAVTKYTMFCPKGHPVRKASAPQQLVPTACPTPSCKTMTSRENCSEIKVEMEMTPGFETVGAYAFDGMTSMSEFCLNDMGHRAALNELGGEKAAINSLQSGGLKYGGTNRAAVGFVQNRAHEWVMNALAIPGQVVPPTFTALELRATDERTDLPVYGPKIAGQAKTAEVPQWFGNTLGTVIYPGDKGPEWRLYLREYRMPNEQAPHLCKVRTTPNTMPEFLTDGSDDAPFTQFSLGRFYELCAESLQKADERLASQLEGVTLPAQPTGVVGGANAPMAVKAPMPAALPEATALNLDTAAPSQVVAAAGAAGAAAAPAAAPAARKAAPPARARAAAPKAAGAAPAVIETPISAEAVSQDVVTVPPAPAAAPVVPAAGVIPAPQEEVQPPAEAKPAAAAAGVAPPTAAPAAPPRAVAPPAAGRIPPPAGARPVPAPAGARPAPRPPQAAPLAVARRK